MFIVDSITGRTRKVVGRVLDFFSSRFGQVVVAMPCSATAFDMPLVNACYDRLQLLAMGESARRQCFLTIVIVIVVVGIGRCR
jgi:hypothetical protein